MHKSAEGESQRPSEDAASTARSAAERESDQGHHHSSVQPKVGVHVSNMQYIDCSMGHRYLVKGVPD